MNTQRVLTVIFVNGVLIGLIALVYGDRVWRANYFLSLGFTPSTSYSLFTFITTGTRGATFLPGLLTLDWLQILLLVLALFDATFLFEVYMERSRRP